MADLALTATVSTFPAGASYNVQQFANAFAQRLIITLPGTNVLFGQIGGLEPVASLPGNGVTPGIWWDGTAFRYWNTSSSKYLPIAPVAGNFTGSNLWETTLVGTNLISNTSINLPADKNGTMALLGDIGTLLGTQTLSGTIVALDWSVKQSAYLVLTGATTINFTNVADGEIQDLWLENNATSNTVTINGVTWAAGVAPVMTTASAGHRKIDHYRFHNVGGTGTGGITYGHVFNNKTGNADYVGAAAAFDITTGTDTTPPVVTSITTVNLTPTITIVFSKLLQGVTSPISEFIVKKAGVVQTMISSKTSGSNVVLTSAINIGMTNPWTVQYTGSSIKDLAGNFAAVFGPSTIVVTTN
jgi:hypothetical protein